MLVLTRKPGESILIGDDIKITVLSNQCGQISLGITAPRAIEVDREEIRAEKVADRLAEQHAAEAELIKGLYVLEFRSRQTGEPLLWMASNYSADQVIDKEPQALALFHAEVHGFPLDEFTVHTIWNPEMIHYHATHLERAQDAIVYSALLAECQAYNPRTPFVVPMPSSAQAAELEGAA